MDWRYLSTKTKTNIYMYVYCGLVIFAQFFLILRLHLRLHSLSYKLWKRQLKINALQSKIQSFAMREERKLLKLLHFGKLPANLRQIINFNLKSSEWSKVGEIPEETSDIMRRIISDHLDCRTLNVWHRYQRNVLIKSFDALKVFDWLTFAVYCSLYLQCHKVSHQNSKNLLSLVCCYLNHTGKEMIAFQCPDEN